MSLPATPLPLSAYGPPTEYGWEERSQSQISSTTAFETRIDNRDRFFGRLRCIICGDPSRAVLQHCHISKASEPDTWVELKEYNWTPQGAKDHPEHGGGGRRTAALNDETIAQILAATHAMPSWKACDLEAATWSGTAQESIQKYIALMGTGAEEE